MIEFSVLTFFDYQFVERTIRYSDLFMLRNAVFCFFKHVYVIIE